MSAGPGAGRCKDEGCVGVDRFAGGDTYLIFRSCCFLLHTTACDAGGAVDGRTFERVDDAFYGLAAFELDGAITYYQGGRVCLVGS